MHLLRNYLDSFTAAVSEGQDRWSGFRRILRIEDKVTYTERRSLGKPSRFFLELAERKFLATACPACGKVWANPRPVCADCHALCEWRELPGTGVLAAYSISETVPGWLGVEPPLVLAAVQMDGAPHTLFTHRLYNFGRRDDVRSGMRVRAVFATEPVGHPLLLMWFEPDRRL